MDCGFSWENIFWTAWPKFLIHFCTVLRFGFFLVYSRRVFIRYKGIHETIIYFSLWAINDFWRLAKQQFGWIRAIKFQEYELHFLLNNLKLGAYPVEAAYYRGNTNYIEFSQQFHHEDTKWRENPLFNVGKVVWGGSSENYESRFEPRQGAGGKDGFIGTRNLKI